MSGSKVEMLVDPEADEGKILPVSMTDAAKKSKMMSKRTLEWTSTKTPATSVGTALRYKVTETSRLHSGIRVVKITARGKLRDRVLTVSEDRFALFCTHHPIKKSGGVLSTVASKLPLPAVTRKGVVGFMKQQDLRDRYVRYVDVADIDYVQCGVVGTYKLECARGENRLKGKDSQIDKKRDQIVIIHHHGNQTLDVIIPDPQDRQELVSCLRTMSETYRNAKYLVSNEALLLRYIWYDVDVDRNGNIGLTEFVKILSRINFNVKNPTALYMDFAKQQGRAVKAGLLYPQVMSLLQIAKNSSGKSMATQVWESVFGAKQSVVSAADFLTKFVHKIQGETNKSVKHAEELFAELDEIEINHNQGEPDNLDGANQLSRAKFEVFLYHEMNDAYDTSARDVDVSTLSRPMSEYWINTSHNTYLTGDQLRSVSSVEMYAKALYRGCKCLELDCYDGEKAKDGRCIPIVYHGHTLTSRLVFGDIIRVVKAYIDENPETCPIILSLENHCSQAFQRAIANDLETILGEHLHVPTSEDTKTELPSPSSLRGKVVVKGKRPPESDESDEAVEEDNVATDEEDPYEDPGSAPASTPSKPSERPTPKPSKIVKELARLTMFHGTKYKSFNSSLKEPPSHMHSISEPKITKILSKDDANTNLWREYNLRHMTRTYPAGARVDSSNYNPVLPWSLGCQLVALNFQTSDSPLLLNDGLYRQNGACGYILKPDFLLGKKAGTPPLEVKVRVLGGSCLPKPKGDKVGETIDPYVAVVIHDVKNSAGGMAAYVTDSYSTSVVSDNGFCPVWNESAFKTFTVNTPDVAIIQFSLKESDVGIDDKVADACIPVSCLRKGYRSIQLFDKNNSRTGPFGFASLLVEIQVK